MVPLKDDFKAGDPTAAITADWLNTVARLLNGARVIGGQVVLNSNGLTICPATLDGAGLVARGGDEERNAMAEGSNIGDRDGLKSISPDLRRVYNDSEANTADWNTSHLVGDWYCGGHFDVNGTGKVFKHGGAAGISSSLTFIALNEAMTTWVQHEIVISGGIVTQWSQTEITPYP
jgi:hypothetical protein